MTPGVGKKHGPAIGYIVTCRGQMAGAGTLCHGLEHEADSLRLGNPVTLFKSRRRAQKAIEATAREGTFREQDMEIVRVAPVATHAGNGEGRSRRK